MGVEIRNKAKISQRWKPAQEIGNLSKMRIQRREKRLVRGFNRGLSRLGNAKLGQVGIEIAHKGIELCINLRLLHSYRPIRKAEFMTQKRFILSTITPAIVHRCAHESFTPVKIQCHRDNALQGGLRVHTEPDASSSFKVVNDVGGVLNQSSIGQTNHGIDEALDRRHHLKLKHRVRRKAFHIGDPLLTQVAADFSGPHAHGGTEQRQGRRVYFHRFDRSLTVTFRQGSESDSTNERAKR